MAEELLEKKETVLETVMSSELEEMEEQEDDGEFE